MTAATLNPPSSASRPATTESPPRPGSAAASLDERMARLIADDHAILVMERLQAVLTACSNLDDPRHVTATLRAATVLARLCISIRNRPSGARAAEAPVRAVEHARRAQPAVNRLPDPSDDAGPKGQGPCSATRSSHHPLARAAAANPGIVTAPQSALMPAEGFPPPRTAIRNRIRSPASLAAAAGLAAGPAP